MLKIIITPVLCCTLVFCVVTFTCLICFVPVSVCVTFVYLVGSKSLLTFIFVIQTIPIFPNFVNLKIILYMSPEINFNLLCRVVKTNH